MNICFLSGRIVGTPEFRFILNKKHEMKKNYHICLLIINIELNDKTLLKLKFFDENADYYFRVLKENYYIVVNGILNNDYEIEVEECFILEGIEMI